MRALGRQDAPDWISEVVAGLPLIVTVKEAGALLRSSQRNIRRLVATGRIKAVRPVEGPGSSRVLIPRSSLERYLRSLDPSGRAA